MAALITSASTMFPSDDQIEKPSSIYEMLASPLQSQPSSSSHFFYHQRPHPHTHRIMDLQEHVTKDLVKYLAKTRIIMVGVSGVGKTCLVQTFLTNNAKAVQQDKALFGHDSAWKVLNRMVCK